MKLRESLFAKLSAVALVLVLSVLVGCGAYFSANLFTRREVYKDSYVETGACERQMEDSAYDVSEYFSLTLLSQKQELTYEQQTELDTLRESIGARDEREFRLANHGRLGHGASLQHRGRRGRPLTADQRRLPPSILRPQGYRPRHRRQYDDHHHPLPDTVRAAG